MNNKLVCPFCGEELEDAGIHSAELYFWCTNCYMKQKDKNDNYTASPRIWQALIQAKQDLEQYERKDNLQQQLNAINNQIQENYKQIVQIDERIIENLEKDLEIARYAITDVFSYVKEHEKDIGGCAVNIVIKLGLALTQITHDNSEKANSVEHKE